MNSFLADPHSAFDGCAFDGGAFDTPDTGPGPNPGTSPLDGTTPAYAFSTGRKLLSSYSGPLIRVRADRVDQPEQDIGFAGPNGWLDEADLASFSAGDDLYLVCIYNQGVDVGPGYKLEQMSAGNQPLIYDAITGVQRIDGRVAASFDGANHRLTSNVLWTNAWTFYTRHQTVANSLWKVLIEYMGSSTLYAQDTNYYNFYFQGIDGNGSLIVSDGTPDFISYRVSSTPSDDLFRLNATNELGGAGLGGTPALTAINVGAGFAGSYPLLGLVSEIVFFVGEQHSQETMIDIESRLLS